MKAGIVGYRGAGKTTIFNVLTGLCAEVGGFHGDDVKNLARSRFPTSACAPSPSASIPKS